MHSFTKSSPIQYPSGGQTNTHTNWSIEYLDELVRGWINESMNEWMNECMHACMHAWRIGWLIKSTAHHWLTRCSIVKHWDCIQNWWWSDSDNECLYVSVCVCVCVCVSDGECGYVLTTIIRMSVVVEERLVWDRWLLCSISGVISVWSWCDSVCGIVVSDGCECVCSWISKWWNWISIGLMVDTVVLVVQFD